MNEVQDEYKGCRIFGSAVGDKPPYQFAGRVEIPLSWGVIDVPIQPSGVFNTQADASAAGLENARLWIISHASYSTT